MQGGGALGAYQAGVYQALSEADLHPDWVAGISIGALNAALIAGNPPTARVARLREFWETVAAPPSGAAYLAGLELNDELTRRLVNQLHALGILLGGAPRIFFAARAAPLFLPARQPASDQLVRFDTAQGNARTAGRFRTDQRWRAPLQRRRGQYPNRDFVYFDSTTDRIGPEQVMASGALPPGFPAIVIDGEHYWEGGLVSNTPLQWVLDSWPRQDTLAFQIDLWNARGELPRDLMEAELRQKEIRFSSRTRAASDQFKQQQLMRRATAKLLGQLPEDLRQTPGARSLAAEADEKVYNIIQLIYHAPNYEGTSKDYEFSRLTMEEHWRAGYNDAVRTLRHPEVLQRPEGMDGVFTFDLARDGRD